MTDTDDDPYYFEIETIAVTIDCDEWLSVPALKTIIQKILPITDNGEASILLTHDDNIQILNKDFRNKDKPTNVLSFPDGEDNYLGDIAIAFETMEKEAKEQEKSFQDHFTHMLIHGLLHLKGYDHENDSDAMEMETLEIKILEDMGIQNPYK